MNKDKKLFQIMIKEFILFMMISLFLIVIIGGMIFYVFYDGKDKFFREPYITNIEIFKNKEFYKLDIEKKYGLGSRFYVFDESFKEIYKSHDIKYPYTYKETLLMPDELDDLETDWIDGDLYKVAYRGVDNNLRTVVIVDKLRNVIYSNKNLKGKVSESELDCLYGKSKEFEMFKQVYEFNGEKYVAVFMFPITLNDALDNEVTMILISLIFLVLGGIAASLYLYLKRLNKNIVKPIEMLEEKMLGFDVERDNGLSAYDGPAEFHKIFIRFNEMAERLKTIQDGNRKTIAGISHDLKTPISVVQLYAKLLDDPSVSLVEKEQMKETIIRKTHEMGDLIALFSMYNQLYHSEVHFEFERVNIVDFCRNYLINKYNELDLMGFGLDVNLPDESIYCMIDSMHFKRVIDNIISNSVKYNPNGTTIVFRLLNEEGAVISIGDKGVGISDDIKERVFEAFVIGDESRSAGSGTGLGMAIVDRIVKLHNGHVKLVESELSVEIEIELPKLS